MAELRDYFIGVAFGVLGLAGGYAGGSCHPAPITDLHTTAKVYQHNILLGGSKQKVMRLHRFGSDQILVGSDENNYITLRKHLGEIKDEADQNLERARIEKLVGWYE